MRTYITPEKFNKFNGDVPDLCYRCTAEKGTLFHCLWACPKVSEFWLECGQEMQKILDINVVPEPTFFLLGIYPRDHTFKRSTRRFIDIGLLLAKRVIAMSWKSLYKPSIKKWIQEMTMYLPLERITYIIKDKQRLFEEVWGGFMDYLKNKNLNLLDESEEE